MESEQKSHLNIQAFFKRRFLKVYLPVLCVTILWMIVSPFVSSVAHFNGYPIEIGEGGKALILSNILIDFGDGVLWFIKVLIFLYTAFYIFSIIYLHNKPTGIAVLCISTILITYTVSSTMGGYTSISIPVFSLGVIVSLLKDKKYNLYINAAILILLCVEGWLAYNRPLAIHCELNLLFIAILIAIFSIRKIDIKVPAILGMISFDLYLVHNKVLTVIAEQPELPNLWAYILVVAVVTTLFFFIRTKLLKI